MENLEIGKKYVVKKTGEIVTIEDKFCDRPNHVISYRVKFSDGLVGEQWADELAPIPVQVKRVTFDALVDGMKETHRAKNSDYGNSFSASVDEYGPVAFFVRASDKMNRAKSLLLKGNAQQVADEKVADTLLDLANYCVMMVEHLNNK